jgi:hypothetical protein
VYTAQAAYGTSRNDTQGGCGDTNNGFGLLVNWNLLGDGTHVVRVLVDGVELSRASFTVKTLGLGQFPRGLSGAYILPNFPHGGQNTYIQWQESLQNFAITNSTGISPGGGSVSPRASLENPQPGSFHSGIGLISGWKCNGGTITILFDGRVTLAAAYGTTREDTRAVCGDTNNGFGLLVNWNLLGTGTHTIQALDNGVQFASATLTVTTFGQEFLRGVSARYQLPSFPQPGKITAIRWQETAQNFVIEGIR